jgi:hypothetical protein
LADVFDLRVELSRAEDNGTGTGLGANGDGVGSFLGHEANFDVGVAMGTRVVGTETERLRVGVPSLEAALWSRRGAVRPPRYDEEDGD